MKKLLFSSLAAICARTTSAQTLYVPSGTSGIGCSTNGNVGIGTSSPGVQVAYMVSDLNTSGSNTASLYAPNVGTQMSHIHLGSTGDWYIRSASTSGKIILQDAGGNVGIGTTNPGSYKLAVEGKIGAREINVIATNPWPDYVFEKNYKLPSLEEIKNYIDQNQHLPEVPSAKEVEKKGVNVGEMNALLLKKIEELTLHLIEQNKRIDDQK